VDELAGRLKEAHQHCLRQYRIQRPRPRWRGPDSASRTASWPP
jgi:hypothetical protein